MDAFHTNNTLPLFTLPLEIREEIYSNLLTPQHIYTSSPTPDTQSLHRRANPIATYVDTRIYFPVRLSSNLPQTCRQLREECLQFYARRLNSLLPATMTDTRPVEDSLSFKLAERNNTTGEEVMERFHDSDTVRITMEILVGVRTNTGFHVPERRLVSPSFLGLLPLLSRLKKIKFTMWAGYSWWSGDVTRPVSKAMTRKARFKRLFSDQDDQVQDPSVQADDSDPSQAPRPNPLAVALDTVLHHLPLVEEVSIDLLLHVLDYTNWDLPEDDKWKGIRSWMDGPICPTEGSRLKKVQRRVIATHAGPPVKSAVFMRQRELLQNEQNTVCVERGVGSPIDDWSEIYTIEEPPFTETYQRFI